MTEVKILHVGYGYGNSSVFSGSGNINKIICLSRFSSALDLGFLDNVKETATVYVPKSQMGNWSSFLNVKEATISNVGKHVLDVYPFEIGASSLMITICKY